MILAHRRVHDAPPVRPLDPEIDPAGADVDAQLHVHEVVAQAGHINTGAFDDFAVAAEVARSLGAWLHIDGAFGLWARAASELRPLAQGAELADSWAVDGHKWLQVPYDSGFAIVRDRAAHERAMAKSAGYLNEEPGEGRNPTLYNPELRKSYLDKVIPVAMAPIRAQEDPRRRLLNSAEIMEQPIQVSTETEDKSVWGLATWESGFESGDMVDPRTSGVCSPWIGCTPIRRSYARCAAWR